MPHLFWPAAAAAAGCFSLSEALRTKVEDQHWTVQASAFLTGGPGLFLRPRARQTPRLAIVCSPSGTPQSRLKSIHATPPTVLSRSARFSFQAPSEWRAKRPASAASTGWRSVHSGTLQGATGGTQTHSRRTGVRLGRLQRARQGLVRVPESNTKYGGKVGRTGGPWAPLLGPSISESSEIPKRKKSGKADRSQLHPLFTGGCWLRPDACLNTTQRRAALSPVSHALPPMA